VSPRSFPSATRRALLGGGSALAVGLAGCSGLDESYSPPADTPDRDDWPHRFHDPGNANAAPEGPDTLTERWSRRVNARLDRPVVLEGSVLTVAPTREDPSRTRVLAYDADTGEREWDVELDGVRRARIVAAVGDRVYAVGERIADADGEGLYAIGTDGSLAWKFDARRIAAVTATGTAVFVSVRRGSVVALGVESGDRLERHHPAAWPGGRWLSDRTPVGRPAIGSGRIFAPFARYDAAREDGYFEEEIVAFDADGIAWRSSLGDVWFVDGVATVGETVYVLTTDRPPGGDDPISSSLVAFDAASGERRWTNSVEGRQTSPFTVGSGAITVAGSGVRTFDRDGELRWREAVFAGPPVIAGDRVYGRRTESGAVDTVVAVDLETGEPTASHTFDHQLNRAPVFAGGRAIARTLEYDRTEKETERVTSRLHMLR
jgi:outer membrane protein assembly factor BamB